MSRKVLLIRNVRPDYYGGGETYQLMLADLLLKYGFEPVIVTSSKKLYNEARRKKYEAVMAPYNKKQIWSGWRNLLFPQYCLWQRKLMKWYKDIYNKYDPVVVNIQSRDDWIAATRASKGTGIRVLWTDHMDMRSWVLKNINVWYKNWIGKWVLGCARGVYIIIMISDYEKNWLENNVMHQQFNNVITIENGVIDKAEEYSNIKVKNNSICYIGRIVKYKGLYELVTAFKAIEGEFREANLNIYGDGEYLVEIKRMIKDDDQIALYGRTDTPLRDMAKNEIFVLPSYREGLSLSLLDAAMMGKKIIASNVGGNPEVVHDKKTGLLVKAKSVDDLKKALAIMLTDKKVGNEMMEAARKLYEKKFDFEKTFVKYMLPIYEKDDDAEKE